MKIKIRKNNYGFTLTEVIVSIIVGLLILILVGNTFILNQRVYKKSNIKAELIQNARITLDLMAREIRQAKEITTPLPTDDSNPDLVAHELQFQDGHIETYIQYIRYYLNNSDLKRQIIVYYFETDCGATCPPEDPSKYVNWDDFDPFGPPQQHILEDKIMSENFSSLDFYGQDNINIELILEKLGEQIEMKSIINPRNI